MLMGSCSTSILQWPIVVMPWGNEPILSRRYGVTSSFNTPEEAGIYKPHPSVYKIAVDSLSLAAQAICFVSPNAWDAHGASAFGLKVAWCNRYGQGHEFLPGAVDVEVSTLAEIPGILGIQG